jgi:hypothetical protein
VGTVFKKTFTKPLPAGSEIVEGKGERFAVWRANGKKRTAPLTTGQDGEPRILVESGKYVAKYRDGGGVVRVEPTGCRDETAARQVLSSLERRAELVKSGVISKGEDAVAAHQATPLDDHFAALLAHLRAKGTTKEYQDNTERCLKRLAEECSFATLGGLRRDAFEKWLVLRTEEGMSAGTATRTGRPWSRSVTGASTTTA